MHPVTYAPGWVMPGMRFEVEQVADQPCIDLWRPHQSGLDAGLKRLFDLAVAIRLNSPGPVLFKQDLYGLDGRRFSIYKCGGSQRAILSWSGFSGQVPSLTSEVGYRP